jgi:hypothetical protein
VLDDAPSDDRLDLHRREVLDDVVILVPPARQLLREDLEGARDRRVDGDRGHDGGV